MKISIWEKAMIKRYNLALPKELYNEIETIAVDNATTVLNVIKKFIKIGFLLDSIQKKEDRIIIESKDGQKEPIELIVSFNDEKTGD